MVLGTISKGTIKEFPITFFFFHGILTQIFWVIKLNYIGKVTFTNFTSIIIPILTIIIFHIVTITSVAILMSPQPHHIVIATISINNNTICHRCYDDCHYHYHFHHCYYLDHQRCVVCIQPTNSTSQVDFYDWWVRFGCIFSLSLGVSLVQLF